MDKQKLETLLDAKKDNSKKNSSSFLRVFLAGLSLAITCVVCIMAIIFVNESTKDIIAKNQSSGISSKIKELLPEYATANDVKISCYNIKNSKLIGANQKLFVAHKDSENLGYVLTYATSLGYSNPLIFIAGFDKNKDVYKVDIKFSQETPGLGDKIDRDHGNYLDQFTGHNLKDSVWDVKKLGGDFDYITGSTVTSRASVIATSNALKELTTINFSTLKKCRE